jgi:hypothetical protein
VRGVIHGPHLLAAVGAVVGAAAKAKAVAIGMLKKPCCWIIFLPFCFFLLCFIFYSISPTCPVYCFNIPVLVTSRSRSRSLSGSPRGGRRDQRRSRSLSYSRSPRRSVSPPAKERNPTPDGSRSPKSPPPKDIDERNGSDGGESPRGRGSRSQSPSDGGRSPVAKGHSPSPRDNRSPIPRDNRSPTPKDNRSPSPMDNGNGDEDRGSPRGSRSP